MRAMLVVSVGAFAVGLVAQALAEEQGFSTYTRADQEYNAKWDKCDALAEKRGTPPGTKGYADFIDECMGKPGPDDARTPPDDGRRPARHVRNDRHARRSASPLI